MRTKWQGLRIMSQSRFIATLTLKQTPINDSNPAKTNLLRENVSKLYVVFSRYIHHCYRTVSVIHSIYLYKYSMCEKNKQVSNFAVTPCFVLDQSDLSDISEETINDAIKKSKSTCKYSLGWVWWERAPACTQTGMGESTWRLICRCEL